MRRLIPAVICLVLASGPALAGGPVPVPLGAPTVVPDTNVEILEIQLGEEPADDNCLTVYDNTVNYTGLFYSDQNGSLSLDGIHSLEGGGLCSFVFGYNQPGTQTVAATIVFYDNNPSDSPPSSVIAGPYVVTGLPAGANSISVTIPEAPVLGPDVWVGVQFDRLATGLLISHPPVVGESYDYFYEIPPGDYFFFGGSPVANFYLKLNVELAVPVQPSTWGLLKTLHR